MKKFMNLIEVTTYFADKKVCENELEKLTWKEGVIRFPHCQSEKKIYRTRRNFKCSEWNKLFSVKKGTIFENSPISLQKWFVAIYIISSQKKGISSHQLGKYIGIRQATAWFILHVLDLHLRISLLMLNYQISWK
jgi:transposase-like protein